MADKAAPPREIVLNPDLVARVHEVIAAGERYQKAWDRARRVADPWQAVKTTQAVVARTSDGQPWGEGVVIAYCAAPTFEIQRPDGTRFSWRADMTYPQEDGRG